MGQGGFNKGYKLKWFKHYSNVQQSELVSKIREEMGLEGLGLYWATLELLCANYDGESTSFEFLISHYKRVIGLRTTNKATIMLRLLGYNGSIMGELIENKIIFNAPIIAKLKDRDFKKSRKGRAKPALDKNRIDKSRVDKSARVPTVSFDSVNQLFLDICGGVGKIKHSSLFASASTIENFKVLLGFPEFQNLEGWKNYFERVSKSKYLTGQIKAWSASLPWLLRPENAEKVLHGTYDDSDAKNGDKMAEIVNRLSDDEKREMGLL